MFPRLTHRFYRNDTTEIAPLRGDVVASKIRNPERLKKIKGNRVTLASSMLIISEVYFIFFRHSKLKLELLWILVLLFRVTIKVR